MAATRFAPSIAVARSPPRASMQPASASAFAGAGCQRRARPRRAGGRRDARDEWPVWQWRSMTLAFEHPSRGQRQLAERVFDDSMDRPGNSVMPPGEQSSPQPSDALEALSRVAGPNGSRPRACLCVRAKDLLVCSASGVALYTLRIGRTALGWEQRVLAFPPPPALQRIVECADWTRSARAALETSPEVRCCRVPVGVVAAEARSVEAQGELTDGEEGIFRLSLAAAARHRTLGFDSAKVGELMTARVEEARRPNFVPLLPFQRALAEDLALGRSLRGICSRSSHFETSASVTTDRLCRALGLVGKRERGQMRYARVASDVVATHLCDALDMAPEEVGI